MQDVLVDFYENTSIIDLFYLVLTIFSLIKSYKKGFKETYPEHMISALITNLVDTLKILLFSVYELL